MGASSAPPIVYNNTTSWTGYGWGPGAGPIWGDEITLAGHDRAVQKIEIFIYSDAATTADTRLRFYANDGAGGEPSTVLYDTNLGNLAYDGWSTISAPVPGILVPDTFTWALQLGNISPAAGVYTILYDPPTIGSSGDFFWMNSGSGFERWWFSGDPVANFAAEVWAVPEPATLSLLALGGLGLLRRRRRTL